MRDPMVSVILPVFNRETFLRATLAGVFAQSFTDWELIVADDGSDEPTRSLLRELGSDARVRVTFLEHTGSPAKTRNAALALARGTWLAFLDSDDLWDARKLERQLERLRLRPESGWCYCGFLRIDEAGRMLAGEGARRWKALEGWIFENILRGEQTILTPCVLASRELVERVGGFDERLQDCEDLDLWLRLALAAQAAVVNEPLVRVRVADGSYSARPRLARVDLVRVLEKMHGLAGQERAPVLRAQHARQSTLLAREYAEAGERGPALQTLARSVPLAWRYPRCWYDMMRTVGSVLMSGR